MINSNTISFIYIPTVRASLAELPLLNGINKYRSKGLLKFRQVKNLSENHDGQKLETVTPPLFYVLWLWLLSVFVYDIQDFLNFCSIINMPQSFSNIFLRCSGSCWYLISISRNLFNISCTFRSLLAKVSQSHIIRKTWSELISVRGCSWKKGEIPIFSRSFYNSNPMYTSVWNKISQSNISSLLSVFCLVEAKYFHYTKQIMIM